MKRNVSFIATLIRMKLSKMMVFRLSFFGAFFVDGSLFLLQLVMFGAIYTQVDFIGGWTKGQMLIFVGTFSLINALNMVIFFFGINSIPDKIKSGSLDYYLTKPVNPLLRLTFEEVNPGSIPLVFLSIGIIAYGISVQGIHVTPLLCLEYSFFVFLMTLLWYDVQLILRTNSFFVISTTAINQLESCTLDMCMKVPGILFKGFWRFLFWLVLPYGIMATLPTQLITRTLSPQGFLYGILITVLFTALALRFWKFGLKHYKSASS